MSRDSYYNNIQNKKSKTAIENDCIMKEILKIHKEFKGIYGSPRIALELNDRGIFVSKNRVARMMYKLGIYANGGKKKKKSYKKVEENLVRENILKQDFKVGNKNLAWAGDITYIPTKQGFVYLAVFIDLCTRKIVGYSYSNKIDSELVLTALNDAVFKEKPNKGLLIHTDRGSQYVSKKYQDRVKEIEAIASMSRPGTPYDNAITESFFKSFKREVITQKFSSKQEVKNAIFEYIDLLYNTKRKHSSLNNFSPIDFENNIL